MNVIIYVLGYYITKDLGESLFLYSPKINK